MNMCSLNVISGIIVFKNHILSYFSSFEFHFYNTLTQNVSFNVFSFSIYIVLPIVLMYFLRIAVFTRSTL